MPVLPWKACIMCTSFMSLTQNAGLAILLHCCFLSCFNRPYIYICSHYYFHRSFVHRWRRSSLSLFVLYWVVCVISCETCFSCKIRPSPRFLLPKFNSVQSIFLNFNTLLIFQFSILCRIHLSFFFHTSHERDRERERERERDLVFSLFFLSLCAYNLTVPPHETKRRNEPAREPAKEQQQNNDHFRHKIHSHLYLSSRST